MGGLLSDRNVKTWTSEITLPYEIMLRDHEIIRVKMAVENNGILYEAFIDPFLAVENQLASNEFGKWNLAKGVELTPGSTVCRRLRFNPLIYSR